MNEWKRLDHTEKTTIAFCGTRGVPANYGGFETAVDEISKRFVEEGYDCEVFCRQSSSKDQLKIHEGRNLVYVKGSNSRTLETFVSAIQTAFYIFKHRKKYKHIFWFNNANFPGIFLTLFAGVPMSINTDGLEWRREKWSAPFKAYYFISSFLISLFCKNLISDSVSIQKYYKDVFKKKTHFIPYGAPSRHTVSDNVHKSLLRAMELQEGKYFLQITRFEPDNMPLKLLQAFRDSGLWKQGYQYVLVGYKDQTPYTSQIKCFDGQYGIRVLNAIYEKDVLTVLRDNCFCYMHGNSVGGTNPALLEAMANCPRIMAIDSPFSNEVMGDLGVLFDPHDITPTFMKIEELEHQGEAMKSHVYGKYQWGEVAKSYMRMAENKKAEYRKPAPVLTNQPVRLGSYE